MSVLFLTADLMFLSRAGAAANSIGATLRVVGTTAALLDAISAEEAKLVLLDLSTPGIDVAQAVARIRQIGVPATIVAYGPHVHQAKLDAALQAGCDKVLSKGQFTGQLNQILAKHAGP
jgi:CheY-like chemotaxis protein